jgi:hypothetical protein
VDEVEFGKIIAENIRVMREREREREIISKYKEVKVKFNETFHQTHKRGRN